MLALRARHKPLDLIGLRRQLRAHFNQALFGDEVIIFDADTGAYKRHWGAYGKPPDDKAPFTRIYDGPGPTQFNTVHGIAVSKDGIVYVGDRVNNRIQSFKLDGTFLKEVFI